MAAPLVDPSVLPQASRVILVRHARPRVNPARPAREWELSPEGRVAARRLTAVALFEHADGFYAGPEPKMSATLADVAAERGLLVQTDPSFAESHAEGWLDAATFLATVGRFITAPVRPAAAGWETAAEAAARFAAGIERLRPDHGPVVHPGHVNPGAFAVASGGRVLTAYLSWLLGHTTEQAFQTWRAMRMPDVAVVEFSPDVAPRLVIPFGLLASPGAASGGLRLPATGDAG